MECERFNTLCGSYLDRELDDMTVAEADAHLALCETCRLTDQRARKLQDMLRVGAQRYRAPAHLYENVRRTIAPAPASFANPRRFAGGWKPIAIAASLMLTIALGTGLTANYMDAASDDRVVDDVIASHIRSLMADHLIDVASSDRHTVKPWFSGKIDVSPPAVDLTSAGFPLVGGRLDYVDDRPCAALVYRHDKHIINVLTWTRDRAAEGTRPDSYSRQGYNLIHVASDALDYWVVSDLNRNDLNAFVTDLLVAAHDSDASG
jgi:anti-sigma factor RsiW